MEGVTDAAAEAEAGVLLTGVIVDDGEADREMDSAAVGVMEGVGPALLEKEGDAPLDGVEVAVDACDGVVDTVEGCDGEMEMEALSEREAALLPVDEDVAETVPGREGVPVAERVGTFVGEMEPLLLPVKDGVPDCVDVGDSVREPEAVAVAVELCVSVELTVPTTAVPVPVGEPGCVAVEVPVPL